MVVGTLLGGVAAYAAKAIAGLGGYDIVSKGYDIYKKVKGVFDKGKEAYDKVSSAVNYLGNAEGANIGQFAKIAREVNR